MLSKSIVACMLLASFAAAETAAPVPKPGGAVKKPVVRKPAANSAATPATPQTANASAERKPKAHRRDPFVSVIQTRTAAAPACSTGKKCLVIGQVVLKGIVKGPDGMLALVENGQRKSYFLRVNDPVFNGEVTRITSDSIVFRERAMDRLGRQVTHEVVKRIPGSKPA